MTNTNERALSTPCAEKAENDTNTSSSGSDLLVPLTELPEFRPLAELAQQATHAARGLLQAAQPIAIDGRMVQSVRPHLEALNTIMEPMFGFLETVSRSMHQFIELGWPEAIQAGFTRVEDALSNAQAMGRFGWTVPMTADLVELVELLRASTSADAADAAFLAFYRKNDGAELALLLADLSAEPRLAEFRPLIEEVDFVLKAEKYRVAVPALLGAFEGTLIRCWDAGVWKQPGREEFFKRKLRTLDSKSFDFIAWTATKAFVDALYLRNLATDLKPLLLNRHWILHGRGAADAQATDCFRLLQAIRTALTLADQAEEPVSTASVNAGAVQ